MFRLLSFSKYLYVQMDNQILSFDILQTCVYFTIISNWGQVRKHDIIISYIGQNALILGSGLGRLQDHTYTTHTHTHTYIYIYICQLLWYKKQTLIYTHGYTGITYSYTCLYSGHMSARKLAKYPPTPRMTINTLFDVLYYTRKHSQYSLMFRITFLLVLWIQRSRPMINDVDPGLQETGRMDGF